MSKRTGRLPQPPSSSPPTARRWLRRLAAALALLVLLLPVLVVVVAWLAGLRVQGPGWRDGPTLALWQLRRHDCLALQGEGLRIADWRPLRIHLDRLTVNSCPSSAEATPPPALPDFDLQVARLDVAPLPPLRLDVRLRAQRWQMTGSHAGSRIEATYERESGRWRASGGLQAADVRAGLTGHVALAGDGLWLPGRLTAQVQARGQGLGQAGMPQRADAIVRAALGDDRRWTLDADLSSPLPLAAGWRLTAHKALSARGDAGGVSQLQADLLAEGPQGQARLLLTGGEGAMAGEGELRLSGPALAGRLPLRWTRRQLTLAPAGLALPGALALTLPQPVDIPLAASGRVSLSLLLRHQALAVTMPDADVSWGDEGWSWQGRVRLSGQQSGFGVDGGWQGRASAAGLAGEPLRMNVRGRDLALAIVAPVDGLRAPDWPLRASFSGHQGAYPLQGALTVRRQGGDWLGELQASSRLAVYDKGGEAVLTMPWLLRDGLLQAQPGSRLTLAQGLKGGLLVKSATLTARTPLRLVDALPQGSLTLTAGGLVSARAGLPALTGDITLQGRRGRASLRLPDWSSSLDVDAALAGAGASGHAVLDTPLSEAMSKGLGFTFRQGRARVEADWLWREGVSARGQARLSDLALDWGGIKAAGGQASLRFTGTDAGDFSLVSEGPVTLDTVDVGTPVTQVSLKLSGDPAGWRLSDVSACALGGRVGAPALHWPAEDYQTITIAGIDLARVVALQGQDSSPVSLTGTVGGELPVRLGRTTLALRQGELRNEVPLTLRILPSAGVTAMSQSNRAVQLAMDTLSNLLVSDFRAKLDMAPDGWLDAAVTLRGDSIQPNRQPVVLNYTHRENVLELLRSLRIGDEISQQVMDRQGLAP